MSAMFEGWDELFLERVVTCGYCDPDRAHSVWQEYQELRRKGEPVQLGQVLVRQRAVTPGELVEVLRELKEIAFRCPGCQATFEIRRYQAGKTYRCRYCQTELMIGGMDESQPQSTAPGPVRPSATGRGVPAQLGYYLVEGELGRGGMGTVYRARHQVLGHRVAIKAVSRSEVGANLLERFRREAASIARLAHPNIVRFLEWGEEGDHAFYAMDLVEGTPLDRRIASAPLQEPEALRIVEILARALHAAHEIGVLHRDLKPSNVILRPDGEPVLLDFGLARLVSAEFESLTGTGMVMGTPSYMSPEQAVGDKRRVDRRTDVYSLGVILYECLTGGKPYAASSLGELLRAVQTTDPIPLRTRVPGIGRETEAICLAAMARDPLDRPATAAALADALRDQRTG